VEPNTLLLCKHCYERERTIYVNNAVLQTLNFYGVDPIVLLCGPYPTFCGRDPTAHCYCKDTLHLSEEDTTVHCCRRYSTTAQTLNFYGVDPIVLLCGPYPTFCGRDPSAHCYCKDTLHLSEEDTTVHCCRRYSTTAQTLNFYGVDPIVLLCGPYPTFCGRDTTAHCYCEDTLHLSEEDTTVHCCRRGISMPCRGISAVVERTVHCCGRQ
jgi:hypothetical protein